MRLELPGRPHLTYCTNIHPGEGLADVRRVVAEHVPRVKALLGRPGRFGVGLRLSAEAARALVAPAALAELGALLDANDLYVFTVNGFPFGAFHGTRVKEAVYRPDWLEEPRLAYSDDLATILAAMLPDGVTGSVSTVPVAFGPRMGDGAARAAGERLARHAAALFRLREATGKVVELALEPEPACFLETAADAVRFFEGTVFARPTVERVAALTGLARAEAERVLRRHVGVCIDACHLAVAFEPAREALDRLAGAGIRVGKIQVTAALSVSLSGDPASDEAVLAALTRFDDGVYLHQVVGRGERPEAYVDLPDAVAARRSGRSAGPAEWRIHFHVPVFRETLGDMASTQPFLVDLLAVVRERAVSAHLEVETYTWGALPAEHRRATVDEAVARELSWTLSVLGSPSVAG